MSAAMIGWLSFGGWLTGWCLATRFLFCRWRPTRVCTWRGDKKYGTRHVCGEYLSENCRGRKMADGSRLGFQTDVQAILAAGGLALVWPVIGIMLILMRKPPQTTEELKARIRELEREAEIR